MTTFKQTDQAELDQLRIKVAQLEGALSSRIIIEQAKGILAERLDTTVDDAFDLLRRSARSSRTKIHDLSARVVNDAQTPAEIDATLKRLPEERPTAGSRPSASTPLST